MQFNPTPIQELKADSIMSFGTVALSVCLGVGLKGDVENATLDTKSKIVLALFSVCNKQTGVS